jgi:hypothetical protein
MRHIRPKIADDGMQHLPIDLAQDRLLFCGADRVRKWRNKPVD